MNTYLIVEITKDKNITGPIKTLAFDMHNCSVFEQWVHAVTLYPQTEGLTGSKSRKALSLRSVFSVKVVMIPCLTIIPSTVSLHLYRCRQYAIQKK